ncbi:hypothetical protein VTJ83DRAFT_6781 [Remersonia thermophila]|uniref:PPPDE domain-containing protein n=1 Tax=Remersonia thermophila TaxID=72144 RepID=A0ABR4D5N5_9PEZI
MATPPPAKAKAKRRSLITGDSDSGSGTSISQIASQKIKSLFKIGVSRGITYSKDSLVKSRIALEQTLGLGAKPNVVPLDIPRTDGAPRPVLIGWHPVAGSAGRWLAERTRLGAWITEKVQSYPDPSQHWAVLVGDYCHELWMDEQLDVIYVNGRVDQETWRTFPVGETRLNDEALKRAGEAVIAAMRAQRPGYHLINNNCQVFALRMLDAIEIVKAAKTEFATTMEVVQTATDPGKIIELFSPPTSPTPPPEASAAPAAPAVERPSSSSSPSSPPPKAQQSQEEKEEKKKEEEEDKEEKPDKAEKENPIVALARRLMEEHTTKLDNHRHEQAP